MTNSVLDPAPPPETAAGGRTITAHFHINLALLVAVAALLLLAAHWYLANREFDHLRLDVESKLMETRSANAEARRSQELQSAKMQEIAGRLAVSEARLAEAQSQQEALQGMYQALVRSRDDWLVAEAEQTLMLAHQQLQLAGNVSVALAGVETLYDRLGESNGPQLVQLRHSLTNDIAALKSQVDNDPYRYVPEIDALADHIDTLSLATDHREATPNSLGRPVQAPAPNAVQRVLSEAWQALSRLVVVRRVDAKNLALLGPDQAYYVRENLKLWLMDARLALLQRHGDHFHHDIQAAQDAIGSYFDSHDPDVQRALGKLARLQAVKVDVAVVDLSASIGLARDLLRTSQQNGASAATASAAGGKP